MACDLGCTPQTAVRVVARFGREGEVILLDGWAANGLQKVDDDVWCGVCEILTGTPRDHICMRPTWTLEILGAVVVPVFDSRTHAGQATWGRQNCGSMAYSLHPAHPPDGRGSTTVDRSGADEHSCDQLSRNSTPKTGDSLRSLQPNIGASIATFGPASSKNPTS